MNQPALFALGVAAGLVLAIVIMVIDGALQRRGK